MSENIEAEATCIVNHKVRILLQYDGRILNEISCPLIALCDEYGINEELIAIKGSCTYGRNRLKECLLLRLIDNRRDSWRILSQVSPNLKIKGLYHLENI